MARSGSGWWMVALLGTPLAGLAQSGAPAANGGGAANGASTGATLEEVTVTAPLENGASLGGVSVSQSDMRQFDRNTLDNAFALASGTSVSAVGPRNETDIWIRGFDR